MPPSLANTLVPRLLVEPVSDGVHCVEHRPVGWCCADEAGREAPVEALDTSLRPQQLCRVGWVDVGGRSNAEAGTHSDSRRVRQEGTSRSFMLTRWR